MPPSKARKRSSIQTALEVFVKGFSEVKSRAWPYEAIPRGTVVWQMRDAERHRAKDYRIEEWISWDVDPQTVDAMARQETRGRFFVCPFVAEREEVELTKAKFKSLGYRLLSTEPLFQRSLDRIPRDSKIASIRLLRSEPQAKEFAAASRLRPEMEAIFLEPSYRQYLAYLDEELVGWVRSVETDRGHWCSNLFVKTPYRRRGLARSLLCQMLRDDRKRGAETSVLLSTHTGALLYPTVGYQLLGTLCIFAPKRSS